MRVSKHGKIVDIPVRAGTIVKLRESRSGRVTGQKGIVVGAVKADAFSRAYGKQVYVCTVHGREAYISETGAGDVYPVGRGRRVPKVCKAALREHKGG
jgi:hypothetical protein